MVVQNEMLMGINPLNLYDVFVNQICGDPLIFVAFSLLIIAIILAKLRVPNQVSIILFVVYGLIISPYFNSVLIITMMAVSMFFSWSMSKFIGKT